MLPGEVRLDWSEQSVGVLTEAGPVPAVVVRGAAGDAVVAQQPITCHFAPQADAADARLEVGGAALTVWAAPCSEEESTITLCSAASCHHKIRSKKMQNSTLSKQTFGTHSTCLTNGTPAVTMQKSNQ